MFEAKVDARFMQTFEFSNLLEKCDARPQSRQGNYLYSVNI